MPRRLGRIQTALALAAAAGGILGGVATVPQAAGQTAEARADTRQQAPTPMSTQVVTASRVVPGWFDLGNGGGRERIYSPIWTGKPRPRRPAHIERFTASA